jgi:ubiquinone/menaquinone biosynthesis C-methylase UbiE
MNYFFEVHRDLPREGPGSVESTRRAYELLGGLPQAPRILDVACGPGAQTRALQELSGSEIVALDYYKQFLEHVRKEQLELDNQAAVHIVNGDMNNMSFAPNSFDLIWSEGAIYIMGFGKGLRDWRRFLRPGGRVAVTECTWIKDNAPEEVREFWNEAYPDMVDVEKNLDISRQAGYEILGHFILPASDWWNYYRPMQKRLTELKQKYQNNPAALQAFEEEEREIYIFENYANYYSYVFYVLQAE